jgi:hypothetical protein
MRKGYQHDKCHMKTNRNCHHTVNPPKHPGQSNHALTPSWHTYKHNHIDKRRKTNGKYPQEQALVWMPNHYAQYIGIENITQAGDNEEEE